MYVFIYLLTYLFIYYILLVLLIQGNCCKRKDLLPESLQVSFFAYLYSIQLYYIITNLFIITNSSVTGLCIRSACPLANSRYATIREEDGVCYLYQKTAERAHSPKNLWEKTRLPNDYTEALELISKELEHFPKYLVHRNKQRLTKIHQMLIRMR